MSVQGICYLVNTVYLAEGCPKPFTCLGLAVVALSFSVGAEREAKLVRVVGQGFARGVRAVVGAAVLALVGRAGVGHLHLMAPLRQWLVGFAVHLLHGL